MSPIFRSGMARFLSILGILALALGAVLSIPRASGAQRSVPVDVALVDVSKSSVARSGVEWAADTSAAVGRFVERAATRGHAAAIVCFGRDVRVVAAPRPAGEIRAQVNAAAAGAWLENDARGGSLETRLSGALSWVRALAAERAVADVVVFGDGTYTGGNPGPIARELAADGIALSLDIPARRLTNLALAPLSVPRELERDAPIVVTSAVRVEHGSIGDRAARVEFTVRDSAGVRTKRVDLKISSRSPVANEQVETIPLRVDLGPAREGIVRIEAVLGLDGGSADPVPEDDRSEAILRCHGTLVVGWVLAPDLAAEVPGAAAPWRIDGIDVVPLREDEIATRLAVLDALVTLDARLDPFLETLVASFVRRGGGWLDLAWWNWIRVRQDGTRPLTTLSALLPDRGSKRPRDVVFLIDASGSMAGEPFDRVREKIGELADAAGPMDDVSVRFFAEDLGAPIHFGKAPEREDQKRRAEILEKVRTARAASGATRILRALEQITAERAGSESDLLVLLLSDGRDLEAKDGPARIEALNKARAAARMRLAAVAPVADVDRDYLKRVADSFVDLADPSRWPDVFREELRERDLVRSSAEPISARPVVDGPAPAAEIARATGSLPPIAAAARSESAIGAQVLWTDERGDPLAAYAQRGAGRVVSIAFTPGSDWAPRWRDAGVLAPIVRALARSERSRRPQARIEEDQIVLENVEPEFAAVVRARVRTADGAEVAFDLFADAGGFDALTTRSAEVPESLAAHAGLASLLVENVAAGDLALPLEIPRRGEFAFEARSVHVPAPALVREQAGSTLRAHPIAPWSIAAGVLALVAAALLGAFSGRQR